jgi:hypothetical protein
MDTVISMSNELSLWWIDFNFESCEADNDQANKLEKEWMPSMIKRTEMYRYLYIWLLHTYILLVDDGWMNKMIVVILNRGYRHKAFILV